MKSLAALALVSLLVSACGGADTESAPATVGPTSTQVAWPSEATNPSIAVPEDALGLVADGWHLGRREEYDEFAVEDVYGCDEEIEWLATGLLALTSESYSPPPNAAPRWLSAVYLDYGSTELLDERLAGFADIEASCAGDRTKVQAWDPPSVPAEFATFGLSQGTVTKWVVTDMTSRAVLFTAADVTPASAQLLSERAARYLQADETPTTTAPADSAEVSADSLVTEGPTHQPNATTTAPSSPSSIPFCNDSNKLFEADDVQPPTDDEIDRQIAASAKMQAVERRFEHSDVDWAGSFYDADSGAIVFLFTTNDPARETTIRDPVGDDVDVRFEQVVFSAAEQQAGLDLLIERHEANPGAIQLSGVSPGGQYNQVQIFLGDIDEATDVATRLDLPPPYDIYCIAPYNSVTEDL